MCVEVVYLSNFVYAMFFDLSFSAVFLGLSHHYFYLKVKTKQKKDK